MELGSLCSSAIRRFVHGLLRHAARGPVLVLSAAALTPVLLVSPVTTRAADAANEPADSGAIAEVIVTATRREENLKDVPISASTLGGVALENLTTAGEDVRLLAGRVPSLNVESSFGRAYPRFYIRGYGN